MAFQETSCVENRVEKEWETKENDFLSLKPALSKEVNEDLNVIFNNNYEVHDCNALNPEKSDADLANALLVVDAEPICGGNKDGKSDASNGHVVYSVTTAESELPCKIESTVHLIEINSYSLTDMKLPSESIKENKEGALSCESVLDSDIMPIVEKSNSTDCNHGNPKSVSLCDDSENPLVNPADSIDGHESHHLSSDINRYNDRQNDTDSPSEMLSNISSSNSSSNSLDTDHMTGTASINNNFNEESENVVHDCLLHPAYVMASSEIEEKGQQIQELEETVTRLKELLSLETSKSERIHELEQTLSQREKEFLLIKKEQEIDKQSFSLTRKEIENKCAVLKKEIEVANREKESMVMRYAVSEKDLINIKKEKETLVKKLKDSMKENESLLEKIKALVSDKSKLSQLLDSKSTDLSSSHKEIDKLKEEINSRDIKIKWTQNKLKTEMETHKECPGQIDKLLNRVRCLEEDLNTAKLESQNLKKQLDESEQNKVLESQLKEEQAKLIMERYEHSEIETKYKSLHTKYQSMIEENNGLSFQVQHLETERLQLEKKLSSSREDTERLSNIVSELQSKLVELDSLNSQLKQSEDKIDTLMNEIERVRHQNEELLEDMSACRARESEMLSFTQKLTTKNVQLQSGFSALESNVSELEKRDEKSRMDLKELKDQLIEAQTELAKENARRVEETRLLARQVAERTKKGEAAESELADTKASLTQSKQKHSIMMKELQRELSQLRRKLETLEASGHVSTTTNSVSETIYAQACDVPREILVERILKLQAEAAKSAEKIEFLEDHSAQLLAEVQKQSRLLQSYMLRENAGALAPSFIDNHKAEISKHGGIMASLYSSTPQDEGMSLELSLEINRKLQSVLEDTLLKNIMLKENLDTLGDEIERLTGKK